MIESFNRIGELSVPGWNHNTHYHEFLLRRLPERRERALDVGSGLGEFTRALATRFDSVDAVDLAPNMVERAREESVGFPNVTYRCADFMEHELEHDRYDCIASIATLHHLPLADALGRMASLLRSGGILLVLDLHRSVTLVDRLFDAAGVAAGVAAGLLHRQAPANAELSAAWADHEPLDHYPTIRELREACEEKVTDAVIRRHVYFRYSLVWRKP